MSGEAWRWVLTLLGVGCEIVGLTWVVAEASRARREEFVEFGVVRSFLRRIWHWFAYWLGPPSQPVHLEGIARGGATAHGSLTVQGVANETEMERLRREMDDLRERLGRHEEGVARRFSEVEGRAQQAAAEAGKRIAKVETHQRELRRAPLRGQVRGARLFIFGAILSAVANLMCSNRRKRASGRAPRRGSALEHRARLAHDVVRAGVEARVQAIGRGAPGLSVAAVDRRPRGVFGVPRRGDQAVVAERAGERLHILGQLEQVLVRVVVASASATDSSASAFGGIAPRSHRRHAASARSPAVGPGVGTASAES